MKYFWTLSSKGGCREVVKRDASLKVVLLREVVRDELLSSGMIIVLTVMEYLEKFGVLSKS